MTQVMSAISMSLDGFVTGPDVDHSHLSRECLRLTGPPPSAFVREVAGRCACGHDHSVSFIPILRGWPRAGAVPA